MKTPQECLAMLSAANRCPDVALTETIALIQRDAHRTGKQDGMEEAAKVCAKVDKDFDDESDSMSCLAKTCESAIRTAASKL